MSFSDLYSGAGNTFLLVDNRKGKFALPQIPPLCQEKGVDGIILVENALRADARMRIFNPDGSEAEMCGNGLRCFVHFLNRLGICRPIYHIETLAGLHKGWFEQEEVCLDVPSPTQLKLKIADNLHFLNSGVPHAILFVDNLENIDVEKEGRALRFSPLFGPAGANVNFVSLKNPHALEIRTYERGVERETLACGTGAIASALIAHQIHGLASPLDVWVRSGERLKISFTPNWDSIILQGPVRPLLKQLKDNH